MSDLKQATELQIYNYYLSRDMDCDITREGKVNYRHPYRNQLDKKWRDGGWIENYKVDERGQVHLM